MNGTRGISCTHYDLRTMICTHYCLCTLICTLLFMNTNVFDQTYHEVATFS